MPYLPQNICLLVHVDLIRLTETYYFYFILISSCEIFLQGTAKIIFVLFFEQVDEKCLGIEDSGKKKKNWEMKHCQKTVLFADNGVITKLMGIA